MKKGEMLDRVYKSDLPSRAKQIMFYLINRANVEGTCFPSIKTIASDCGVSERTVQRTMQVLLEKGFIKKDYRFREKGGQTSNLYTLVCNDKSRQAKYQDDVAEHSNDCQCIENVRFEYYNDSQLMDEEGAKESKGIDFLDIDYKLSRSDNFLVVEKSQVVTCDSAEEFLCRGESDNLHPP